jgi:probable rRNA maturation factor
VAAAARIQPPIIAVTRRGCRDRVPARRLLQRWAVAALGRRVAGREISVLLVDPVHSRRLNHRYRGRDHSTNVLSFPAAPVTNQPAVSLGDLVICPQVLNREAREQGKRREAHWTHLFVHGLLHLVGYDHEQESDAVRMERREIRVLRQLGVGNPYRSNR